MIKSYRSRPLKRFAAHGDASKLPVQNVDRVRLLLVTLDAAASAEALNLPGFGFHGLQGKPKRYAVSVNGNYRVTFGFEGEHAVDVDLEDYH